MAKIKRVPIKERILKALDGSYQMEYFKLMRLVFPPDQYPKATNYQSNGGPAGCCMAFGKALRELGGGNTGQGSARMAWINPKRSDKK